MRSLTVSRKPLQAVAHEWYRKSSTNTHTIVTFNKENIHHLCIESLIIFAQNSNNKIANQNVEMVIHMFRNNNSNNQAEHATSTSRRHKITFQQNISAVQLGCILLYVYTCLEHGAGYKTTFVIYN